MEAAKEIINTVSNTQIEMNKTNVGSNEKIRLKDMQYRFIITLIIYGIVVFLSVIGGISGYVLIKSGRSDIGYPIITSTVTGVLGFLGGRATASK